MDEKKAYGLLLALGKAVGEAARSKPDLVAALRAAPDAAALEEILVAHRGSVPESLAREYVRSIPPVEFVRERSKLVIQAKSVAAGIDPVSPGDARKGPVRQR